MSKQVELKNKIRSDLRNFASGESRLKEARNFYFQELSSDLYHVYQKLTVTDLLILHELSEEVIYAKQLVSTLPVTQGAVSKCLSRLEKYKLVKRTIKESDKRESILSKTSTGEKIAQVNENYRKIVDIRFNKIIDRFSENDLCIIEQFLSILNDEIY